MRLLSKSLAEPGHCGTRAVQTEGLAHLGEESAVRGGIVQKLHQRRLVDDHPAQLPGMPGQQVEGDDRARAAAEDAGLPVR